MDTDGTLDTLGRAAAAWDPGDDTEFLLHWTTLPVKLRALLTMTALAATDHHLSANAVASAGRFSRGTAYTKHRDDLDLLTHAVPEIVAALLHATARSAGIAELEAERQQANVTIGELRGELTTARQQVEALRIYAAELHNALKPEYEENLRTRTERVIDIAPRLRPVPDTDDTA